MKPIFDIFTAIAREHLFIETLKERKSDRLDFHEVSVWGVQDALLAAYQAGVNASAQSGGEAGVLREMREALERLAYDAGGDQNNPLIRDKTLESIERARVATAKAKTASSQQNATAHLPIVTVTVRGGLIEDLDATIPVHAVVEDWDVPDEDTGKKPARSVWELTGGLSGPKAEKLRRLIAND